MIQLGKDLVIASTRLQVLVIEVSSKYSLLEANTWLASISSLLMPSLLDFTLHMPTDSSVTPTFPRCTALEISRIQRVSLQNCHFGGVLLLPYLEELWLLECPTLDDSEIHPRKLRMLVINSPSAGNNTWIKRLIHGVYGLHRLVLFVNPYFEWHDSILNHRHSLVSLDIQVFPWSYIRNLYLRDMMHLEDLSIPAMSVVNMPLQFLVTFRVNRFNSLILLHFLRH